MEFSSQQIQDFLVREFGMFLWLEEALVEDEELQELITSGTPTIESELKDGVRLCKLVRLIDPDYVPAVKEGEAHVAYKCRQKIKLFLEGCADLGVPAHNQFLVTELYDERNILRVLECLEKLAEVADARWYFPFKLKGKKQTILEMGKFFTKEEQERAITILRKSQPSARASVALGSVFRDDPGAEARGRPASLAGWTHQRPVAHTVVAAPRTPGAGRRPPLPLPFTRSASNDSSGHVSSVDNNTAAPSEPAKVKVAAVEDAEARARREEREREEREEREREEREREENELQERRLAEARFERAVVCFQSFFRGHQARKQFRAQMRNALRRENVAREIYRTEHAYVYNLRLLVHVFLSTLDATPTWHVRGGQAVELEKMKILSRQIAPILGFNKKLITEYLEPRMQHWNFHSKLGDIFVQISAYLKLYCDYVNNYGLALQELLDAKKKATTLADFLKAQQEIPREFAIPSVEGDVNSAYTKTPEFKRTVQGRVGDIADYLIQPIQRIPRYLLLLKELVRFTEPTHPDYAELQKALEGIKEVTEFIEAQTSKAHNLSKLASIQSRLVPANQLKLLQPHRKFLKEGRVLVRKAKKKDKQERILFLFTDLLLETKPKHSKTKSWEDCPLKIEQALDLTSISAMTRISVGDSDHGFLVVNEAKRLQDILLDVQCATKIERYDWATAIHTAKRNITTQLQQRAGTHGGKTELLNKTGAMERIPGVKTYSEGHGHAKPALPSNWAAPQSAPAAGTKWSVVNYASVGRSHNGRLLSQEALKEEKRQGKEQKKKEKEERKGSKKLPEKVRSDVGATTTSSASADAVDAVDSADGDGQGQGGQGQPGRKGHTRNKSWTLSFKDMGKRNKLARGSGSAPKDSTFDGLMLSPRADSAGGATAPVSLSSSLSAAGDDGDDDVDPSALLRQATHANGNRPPIPFMLPRSPAPMFAHVALSATPGGGPTTSGTSGGGVRSPRSPPSFGSLSSPSSSTSSSPTSSPRGQPTPLSSSTSSTSTSPPSPSSGGGAKVPSPRSRGFTYTQSPEQQLQQSPLASNNARGPAYVYSAAPSPGSGKSASTIVPSGSGQHPVITRAASIASLPIAATPSPSSAAGGTQSAPVAAVDSPSFSASRRPAPPVPPKNAKPAVLLGQVSPRGMPAKPTDRP